VRRLDFVLFCGEGSQQSGAEEPEPVARTLPKMRDCSSGMLGKMAVNVLAVVREV